MQGDRSEQSVSPAKMSCERSVVEWEDVGRRFSEGVGDYGRQYCHVYQRRLALTRPRLEEAARAAWGPGVPVRKTVELEAGKEAVLIGVVVKHQALRPSVLRALAEGIGELPQPLYENRNAPEDTLALEDEVQPIPLGGDIAADGLCTGVVVALRGHESEEHSGDFLVSELLFLPPCPSPRPPPLTDDVFVLFVSGLEFSGQEREKAATEASLELLLDWVAGLGGDEEEVNAVTSRIARVVVAGNLLSVCAEERELTKLVRRLTQKRKAEAPTAEAVRAADGFLARLCPALPVDLMPGQSDPSNWMLPQRPLHHSLFPQTAAAGGMGNLHLVSNPYDAKMAGRRLLGTSGQNLDDLYRFAAKESPMELLERVFRYQHLAPGAPDTLASLPLFGSDPLLVSPDGQPCPAVLFAGCQRDAFARRRLSAKDGTETELFVIPSFANTPTAVLLNLRTLHSSPVTFDASLSL